jgi:Flp pilus assembly protein TadD
MTVITDKLEPAPRPPLHDPFLQAKRAVRSRKWVDAQQLFVDAEHAGAVLDPQARLLRTVADLWVGGPADYGVALARLDPAWIGDAQDVGDLKRLLISPLVQQSRLADAILAQRVLVVAQPGDLAARTLLARYQGKVGDWVSSAATLEEAAPRDDADPELAAQLIQTYLQAGQVSKAAHWARRAEHHVPAHLGLAFVILTALMRAGDSAAAVTLADRINPLVVEEARLLGAMVEAYLAQGQGFVAIEKGEAAIEARQDGVSLRLQLARAYLETLGVRDAQRKAIGHLQAAREQDSDNLRIVSLLGETLLRFGRFPEAVEALAKAYAMKPASSQVRALLARALKYDGQHAEAAAHFRGLAEKGRTHEPWARFATGALLQAGRHDEAKLLYNGYLHNRRATLTNDLQQGLDALWARTDKARIPQARLDWAWSLADQVRYPDRAAWERRAKWGYLADHLLLDWLECRDDRIEDAMHLLADLDETDRFFQTIDMTRGIVVATAHIGPLYAGPMILELLGLPAKWLASTPNVGDASYADSLISTSDQTEAQVVKASLKALGKAGLVSLALDGASNPAAPRIMFQGQEMTYSSFAARITHRSQVPSLFYAPAWVDGKVSIILRPMPPVEPEEDVASFAGRWRKAYLEHLLDYLRGPPENLRLAGGMWRHIRKSKDQLSEFVDAEQY